MGKFDSSRTRVAPVFDWLRDSDATGQSWLPSLLSLPTRDPHIVVPTSTARLQQACWWPKERQLSAPKSLLRWLVQNTVPPRTGSAWGGEYAKGKRTSLTQRDPEVIAAAMARLDAEGSGDERAWHVLEGPTCPDVYLETEEQVVVIEGKRTEAGPTTYTTWMPIRHQMLRHIDAARDVRGTRPVFGFFIVEGEAADDTIPDVWVNAARQTIEPTALAQSLPHRSEEARREIADAFIGVTTWQAVCRALSIPEAVLIDEVR